MEINPEKAIRYIQEHAEKYAKAKGDVAYTENYLKVVKSQQMNKSESSSLGQREADAYATGDYVQAILAHKQAVEEEAHLKWMLTAAQARIEVWKTQEYSKRSEMRNLGWTTSWQQRSGITWQMSRSYPVPFVMNPDPVMPTMLFRASNTLV